MRSRFNHDGSLDHHAHNEHELLRRADEALERQRREAHTAKTAEQLPLGQGLGSSGSALAAKNKHSASPPVPAQSPMGGMVPKMPHEELAERFAVKPTRPHVEPTLAWPPRKMSEINSITATRRHGNRQ